MSEQATMTGPALLRDWAEKIEHWNWRPGQLLGPVALRQMAGGWEADLNYSAGLIADATLRAERAEAALEQARALIPADVFECVAERGYKLCGCGMDHCSFCTFPEWTHSLASLLSPSAPSAPGGAA